MKSLERIFLKYLSKRNKKYYRRIKNSFKRRKPLYVFLTLLSSFFVTLIDQDNAVFGAAIALAVCAFQFFIIYSPSLYSRYVPIEVLNEENINLGLSDIKGVFSNIWLLPLLVVVSPTLAFLALFYFVFKYRLAILKLYDRRKQRKILVGDSLEIIASENATVVVYVSGLANVAYQINQWISVLQELDQSVIILVRQRGIYRGMIETDIPVVYARNMIHVEKVLSLNAKVVLYPANTMHNVQALRQYKLKHFFINHGESDKSVNQSKLLQAYDKLLVAGPLAHDRLIEAGLSLRDNQVEYVGRPQTQLKLNKLTENERIDNDSIIRVLYAPTWEGFVELSDYCSIRENGLRLLRELIHCEGVEVTFKPHPYTGKRSASTKRYLSEMLRFCAENSIEVVASLKDIHDCMNDSDVLITDISSVLNDYLYTEKPIILTVNDKMKNYDMLEDFPSSKAAYLYSDSDNISGIMEDIRGIDSLKLVRSEVLSRSLGENSERSLETFNNVINKNI